jgi:tRNA-modifying protein YgfZ
MSWLQFLEGRGARLSEGRVDHFGDAPKELLDARDGTIVAGLSHHALIEVTGPDARAFLQAQLTNDVNALADDSAQWSGWCSPKGRLLASFLVVRRGESYQLMMAAGIAEAIRKRLSMFVLRSKVKLEDASPRLVRMGLAGTKAAALLAHEFDQAPGPMQVASRDDAAAIGLEFGRFVVIAPKEKAEALWQAFASSATESGADAWDWTSVRAGIPTIVPETQDAFVPQMANYDLINAVSFRKGCYPGQEIVARTQYRGILKKRMAQVHVDSTERPRPGDSVYSTAFGDQSAGTLANVAPAPDGGFDALVVAQIEGLDRNDLRLRSPDGPALTILSRPSTSAGA